LWKKRHIIKKNIFLEYFLLVISLLAIRKKNGIDLRGFLTAESTPISPRNACPRYIPALFSPGCLASKVARCEKARALLPSSFLKNQLAPLSQSA
jgi:hypothetical protein